jgi:drug/metabolite transporter (DMT)-like permease
MELALGLVAAVFAATLFSLGFALQALDARESPQEEHLRMALALRLVRRVRWLSGTALSILGWPLQVLALGLAPLVVVQPALALGLPVLMVVGERMLGERAGTREHLAVGAIVLGVVGAALCAPARSDSHAGWATLSVVLALLALASLLPYALLRVGRPPASVTMLGAGFAFGWSGVATKLASDDLSHGYLLVALGWGLTTAGASAVASLSEMSALQSRPAIQVAPVVFVTQTIVPVLLAPLLFHERFSTTPLGGVPLVGALALVVVGAVVLARSPLLLALMPGGAVEEPVIEDRDEEALNDHRGSDPVSTASDSAPSRSERSEETSRSSPATEEAVPATVTTRTSPARARR